MNSRSMIHLKIGGNMKTNKMIHQIGKYYVTQRVGDSYFNATELLNQWNDQFSYENRSRVDKFLQQSDTQTLIDDLRIDNIKNKLPNPTYYQLTGKITRNRKEKQTVWMHPYLFISFCFWLGPEAELMLFQLIDKQDPNLESIFSKETPLVHYDYTITYIAYNHYTQLYKIGRTTKIEKRMKYINNNHPKTKHLFYIIGNHESNLHQTFKDKNVRVDGETEWFNLSDSDLAYLQMIQTANRLTPELRTSIQKWKEVDYLTLLQYLDEYIQKYYNVDVTSLDDVDKYNLTYTMQNGLATHCDIKMITSFKELLNKIRTMIA